MDLVNAKKLAKHRIGENNGKTFVHMLVCRLLLALCGLMPPVLLNFSEKTEMKYAGFFAAAMSLAVCTGVCSALRTGREKYFFSLAESGKCSFSLLFSCFRPDRFFRSLRWWCFYYCVRTGRTVLFLLPFGVSLLLIFRLLTAGGLSAQVLAVFLLWSAAMLLCGIGFLTVYNSGDLLFFRYVTQSGMSAPAALKKSREVMRGRLGQAAVFRLRFWPRMLFCAFIIPGVFAYRYYKESCCILSLTVVDGNEKFC